MALITYDNKETLVNNPVAEKYKCTADNLNEIKTGVNTNEANIGTLSNLNTTNKSSLVGAINEVQTGVNDSGWIQISNNITSNLYYRVVGKLYYLKGSFTGANIGSNITLPFTPTNLCVWNCAGNGNYYAKVYIDANTNILGLNSHTGQSGTTYVINFAFYLD